MKNLVVVFALMFVLFGCDQWDWAKKKVSDTTCKVAKFMEPKLSKAMVSRWEAKKPECLKELPLINKCFIEKETAAYSINSTSNIAVCQMIMDQGAKIGSKYIADKCEANYDLVYSDLKNGKQACYALIALGVI